MKYLTTKQLNITEEERVALLKVKHFLKGLKLPKNLDSRYNHSLNEVTNEGQALFYMNKPICRFDCGTGGCIGGWMYLSMHGVPLKKKVSVTEELAWMTKEYIGNMRFESSPLCQLFYPQKAQNYDSITPTRAVEEIETFLKTGKATW
jgi:hypothetical protein